MATKQQSEEPEAVEEPVDELAVEPVESAGETTATVEQPESRDAATTAFKSAVATFIGQQGRLVSLHTGDPGATGTNEVSSGGYTKQLTTWGAPTTASDGRAVITGSMVTFSVPGAVPITYYGVWSGTSAGTPGNFLYAKQLEPTATLTVAGQVNLTPTHAYGLLS